MTLNLEELRTIAETVQRRGFARGFGYVRLSPETALALLDEIQRLRELLARVLDGDWAFLSDDIRGALSGGSNDA